MTQTPDFNAPIGVFDSGVGGLSVLRALRAALPHERFVYFADSAHAPYGEKGDAFVLQRSMLITEQLIREHGLKALVVACNTATAAAITPLRTAHPDLIIIGIEPALKPAAAASITKHVAVLATRGTLVSHKFQSLLAAQSRFAAFSCHACDGLAETIEANVDDLNSAAVHTMVHQHIGSVGLLAANSAVDTLVLGCTHYPLVKTVFQALLAPHIQILDNGEGVANQLALRLGRSRLLRASLPNEPAVVFLSSAAFLPNWQSVLNPPAF